MGIDQGIAIIVISDGDRGSNREDTYLVCITHALWALDQVEEDRRDASRRKVGRFQHLFLL